MIFTFLILIFLTNVVFANKLSNRDNSIFNIVISILSVLSLMNFEIFSSYFPVVSKFDLISTYIVLFSYSINLLITIIDSDSKNLHLMNGKDVVFLVILCLPFLELKLIYLVFLSVDKYILQRDSALKVNINYFFVILVSYGFYNRKIIEIFSPVLVVSLLLIMFAISNLYEKSKSNSRIFVVICSTYLIITNSIMAKLALVFVISIYAYQYVLLSLGSTISHKLENIKYLKNLFIKIRLKLNFSLNYWHPTYQAISKQPDRPYIDHLSKPDTLIKSLIVYSLIAFALFLGFI